VAVNGYGVIGKRIADAVVAQEDMDLVGVADVVSDWRIRVAVEKGYPIYASTPQAAEQMRAAGISVVVRDDHSTHRCRRRCYAEDRFSHRKVSCGGRRLFQGGEKHSLTG
jgi:glyceraldehyde-3-phosphate dehydrogenase (NAD(P))